MNKRVLLILLLGLLLRLNGISFGLPHLYHADEPVIVNHALAYGSGDLNPHFFNIPPLTSYLLFVFYGIYFVFGLLTGQFHSVQDFEHLFYADPTSFYLIARVLLGAVLGTASIALLYRMLKKHFNGVLAEIAAFLFAVYFLHVRDSHYIYADIPLIFSMLMSFALMMEVLDSPSLRRFLFAGAWIGISTAFKYNGVFLWPPFICVLLVLRPAGLFKKLVLALTCSAAMFLILNPYALADAPFFIKELAEQGRSQTGAGWIHHFRYSLLGSAGIPMMTAALAGLLLLIQKRDLKRVLFAAFGIIYYGVLVFKGQPYDRYVLPLVPIIVFFASDFILAASQNPKGLRKGVLLTLVAGIIVPSLTRCLLWDTVMQAKDARTVAQEWIEKHVPSGETFALDWDFLMPRLRMSSKQLEAKNNSALSELQQRRLRQMLSRTQEGIPEYELYTLSDGQDASAEPFLFEKPKVPYDLNALKARGIHYVVVAAYAKDRDPAANSFYRDLREQGVFTAEITPYKDKSIHQPLDAQPLTGGPFLLRDLKARKSNGQPLQVYKIQ